MIRTSQELQSPTITLVTPTFNRVEFLEECIQSVLSQSYPKLQYIICDGGSKNSEVLEVVKKYEKDLFHWDSVPDIGHAQAIRRGFDMADGQIMGYLCSDDYLLQGALAAVAAAWQKSPTSGVFYGNTVTVDQRNTVIGKKICFPFHPLSLFTTLPWSQPSTFWTREAYQQCGGNFGGKNWEWVVFEPQIDLISRLYNSNARFQYVSHFLAADRRHPDTVNARQSRLVRKVSWERIRKAQPFVTHPLVHNFVRILMRVYQLAMLIRQQEYKYLWERIYKKNA